MALSTQPNRFYPSIPGVTEDTATHTNALQQIRESIETHERRNSNYLKSFIRFEELVELGIIDENGNNLLSSSDDSGGGTGAENLPDLDDVTIAAPLDNDILGYDFATSQWTNQNAAELNLATLDDLSALDIPDSLSDLDDVDTTGANTFDLLYLSTTGWVPTDGQLQWDGGDLHIPTGDIRFYSVGGGVEQSIKQNSPLLGSLEVEVPAGGLFLSPATYVEASTDFRLQNSRGIRWYDSGGVPEYFARVLASGSPGQTLTDAQFLQDAANIDIGSTTFTDAPGQIVDVSELVDGDEYFYYFEFGFGNSVTNNTSSNEVRLIYDGVELPGSVGIATDAEGAEFPYQYGGVQQISNTAGDIQLQQRQGGAIQNCRTRDRQIFAINTTRLGAQNFLYSEDLTGVSYGTAATDSAASVTLSAGDWLVFANGWFDGLGGSGSTNEHIVWIRDGSTDYQLTGHEVENTTTQPALGGVVVLEGVAADTVVTTAVSASATGGVSNRQMIAAFKLSGFVEYYTDFVSSFAQPGNGTPTVASTSFTAQNSGEFIAIAGATVFQPSGSPSVPNVEVQINGGGYTVVSDAHRRDDEGTANRQGYVALPDGSFTVNAGDTVDVRVRFLDGANLTAETATNISLAVFSLTTADASVDTFVAGNSDFPTEIDGTLIRLDNNLGVNWQDGVTDVELLNFVSTAQSVVPPTADTQFYLSADGNNGDTTVTDNNGNTWNQVDPASTLSSEQIRFGTTSIARGGSQAAGGFSTPDYDFDNADGTGDFHIGFWYYVDDPGETGGFSGGNTIVGQRTTVNTTQWRVVFNNNGLNFNYNVSGNDAGENRFFNFTGGFARNAWVYIAIERNAGVIRAYINNVVRVTTLSEAGTLFWGGGGDLEVANEGFSSITDNLFVDDVLFITGGNLYGDGSSYTGPQTSGPAVDAGPSVFTVGDENFPTEIDGTLIRLDNEVGVNWQSSVGDDVELLTLGLTGTVDTDITGTGVDFAGNSGSYMSIPDSSDFDIGSDLYTIEVDVYLDQSATDQGNNLTLVDKRIDGPQFGWTLVITEGSDEVQFSGWAAGNATPVISIASTDINFVADQLYRIALVRDAGGVWSLYVDNVRVATGTETAAIGSNNSPVSFGRSTNVADGQRPLDGKLDNIRLTRGVARYSGATITQDATPFSTNVGGDPNYNSVEFLTDCNGTVGQTTLTDQGPDGRAVTLVGSSLQQYTFTVPGTQAEAFNIGDPAFPTIIDGSAISLTANTDVTGSLDVTGATTLNNTLDVVGAVSLVSTLDVDGAVTFNSTLDVTGAVTALSYGGILEENLLDKTAPEEITAVYTFKQTILIDEDTSNAALGLQVDSTSFQHDITYNIEGTLVALYRYDPATERFTWNDRDPTAREVLRLELADGTEELRLRFGAGLAINTEDNVTTSLNITPASTTGGATSISATGDVNLDNLLRVSGGGTVGGAVLTDELRTRNGNYLIINAGESSSFATGQTGELVYINAEGGLAVVSSPNNWGGNGWDDRQTAFINNSSAQSSFPGQTTSVGNIIAQSDVRVTGNITGDVNTGNLTMYGGLINDGAHIELYGSGAGVANQAFYDATQHTFRDVDANPIFMQIRSSQVDITLADASTPLALQRISPTTDQVSVSFEATGLRYFGKGTDDEPYWATTANITGTGDMVITEANDPTISGDWVFDNNSTLLYQTNSNTTPLIISRLSSVSEAISLGVEDTIAHFRYDNDEISGQIRFTLDNADTETGGGAGANTSVFEMFASDSLTYFLLPPNGEIRLQEKAADGGAAAGRGSIWVRNDSPNVLIFTDDTGVDHNLIAGGGGGDVSVSGTPVANQMAVWVDATTIEGSSNLNNVTDGIQIVKQASTDVGLNIIRLSHPSGTLRGFIGHSDTTLRIENQIHGGLIVLDGENASGVGSLMAEFNPDGPFALYYDGSLNLQGSANGINVYNDDTGNDIEINLVRDGGLTRGRLRSDNFGAIYLEGLTNDESIVLSPRTGGSNQNTVIVDPQLVRVDGKVRAGTGASTDGMTIIEGEYQPTDFLNILGGLRSSGSTTLAFGVRPDDTVADGYVSSADNVAFGRSAFEARSSSFRWRVADSATVTVGNPVTMTTILETQDFDATGATSALRVVDHGGTMRDVGFNTLTPINFVGSVTLSAIHCGALLIDNAVGGSNTLTLLNSSNLDFPVGGTVHVMNDTGVTTIQDAASGTCNLYKLELGTGFTLATGGDVTLNAGAVVTIWRRTASDYYIWGSGVTD